MPSRAKTRAIDLAAGRLAAATFDPQISAGREAIGISRGNLEGTRAALGQFFRDSQSRYDKPVETKDLDASMQLMNANRLAYANNDVASQQDNKLRNFASLYANQLSNRQRQADELRSLARAREQDLTRDNETYYRNQMREGQSNIDKLVGQRGALQAQTYNQMFREQEQRDFQSAESRRARAFQAEQNRLAREAQQAQSQRQYNLALQQLDLSRRQFREGRRQFNVRSRQGSGEQPLTLGERNNATWIARTWLPIWLRDNVYTKGGRFSGKNAGRAVKYLEDQGITGAQFFSPHYKNALPGRFQVDPNSGATTFGRYKWTPRELAEALRQRGIY